MSGFMHFTYFIPHAVLSEHLQVNPEATLRVLDKFFGCQVDYVRCYTDNYQVRCIKVHMEDAWTKIIQGIDGYGLHNTFAQASDYFSAGTPIWTTCYDAAIRNSYDRSR